MTVRRKHSNKIVTLRMTEWQSDTKHSNQIVTLSTTALKVMTVRR
jgi:hypothetical protein